MVAKPHLVGTSGRPSPPFQLKLRRHSCRMPESSAMDGTSQPQRCPKRNPSAAAACPAPPAAADLAARRSGMMPEPSATDGTSQPALCPKHEPSTAAVPPPRRSLRLSQPVVPARMAEPSARQGHRATGLDHRSGQRCPFGVQGFSLGLCRSKAEALDSCRPAPRLAGSMTKAAQSWAICWLRVTVPGTGSRPPSRDDAERGSPRGPSFRRDAGIQCQGW